MLVVLRGNDKTGGVAPGEALGVPFHRFHSLSTTTLLSFCVRAPKAMKEFSWPSRALGL